MSLTINIMKFMLARRNNYIVSLALFDNDIAGALVVFAWSMYIIFAMNQL